MKTPTEKTVMVVKWACETKGLKVYQLEDKCDIPRGSIGKWVSGDRTNLSSDTLSRMLMAFPEISAEWMMRDEANYDMIIGSKKTDEEVKTEESDENIRLIDENAMLKKKLEAAYKYIEMLQSLK